MFPDTGTALQRYAAMMAGVEVNSSFHRPHRRSTWQRWGESVPGGFRFVAKIPKEISHIRRLIDVAEPLAQFLGEVEGLGDKLAVLLVQLPPSLAFDADVVPRFFADLTRRTAARVVCEPRHASWFDPPVDALLAGSEIARVAADPARVPAAALPGGWRGITYRRLHGSPVMYRSAYGAERLPIIADAIRAEGAMGMPSWCMFDNTASSAALGDARLLAALLAEG